MSSEEIKEITTDEIQESEITEITPTEPTESGQEQKSIKELAREKLTEKLENGFDLANKKEKARLCHEIKNEITNLIGSCSYDAVAKEVPYVLKAKKEIKTEPEISTVGGNQIKKIPTDRIRRPQRTTNETELTEILSDEAKQKLLKEVSEPDEFEQMSIEFALQDVSFFISSLGLPQPKMKMLTQRAKQIAMYNGLQRAKGKPENVIEIGDKLLKYAIYIGLASTFLQPIISKYFPKGNSSKKEIQTKSESLI